MACGLDPTGNFKLTQARLQSAISIEIGPLTVHSINGFRIGSQRVFNLSYASI